MKRASRKAPSSLHLIWVLLAALAVLNAALLWGTFASRRGARSAAEQDLELRTAVLARSVEAELASLRADFLFLAQSPPLAGFVRSRTEPDRALRHQREREAEETLVLFLDAHPEVRRLEVEDADGVVLLVAGWLGETPSAFEPTASPGTSTSWFRGRWPIDRQAPADSAIHTWVDQDLLLSASLPSGEELAHTFAPVSAEDVDEEPGRLRSSARVIDGGWEPPVHWILEAREAEGQLLRSVESLTGLYSTALGLNTSIMILSLGLGWIAVRNLRRVARLEAEREQQLRVRELERQISHSERLASVGRLAAGLAHEINNPLEGVSNFLALAEEDLGAGHLEGCQTMLDRAREGVQRAAQVTRQVLSYSDPGRGSMQRVDLRDVIRSSVEFVSANLAHGPPEIAVTLPEDPILVEGNSVTLGQVFLNLLLNAAEAQTDETTSEVRVDVSSEPGAALVRIRDRGPGIASGELERLFEPFYSTKGSTGLGLAVSKSIVESHRGDLSASNRSGGGAQLLVRLPTTEASAKENS